MKTVYYVYFLLDPRTSQPFYVGKGKGNRITSHEVAVLGNYKTAKLPHHDRIRELHAVGLNPVHQKFQADMTEKDALLLEKNLIEQYGRIINGSGILLNKSPGSETGSGISPKPVDQFDLNGVFIKTWESAKEASEQVPTANRAYITQVCKGKRITAGGFLWAYKGNSPRPNVRERQRAVEQFTKEGVSLGVHASLRAAQDVTGVPLRSISDCCRRPGSSAGGFKWSYA